MAKRRKVRHIADLTRIAARALGEGGARIVRPRVIEWDVSGGCSNPFAVTLEGRSAKWGHSVFQNAAMPDNGIWGDNDAAYGHGVLWIDMDTPCRRCDVCLRRRAAQWRQRAKAELALASRTWFGTLTMSEEEHVRLEYRAAVRVGKVWSYLTDDERFREVAQEGARDITLWLKRVRKESGARLRYVLVTEAHKSGRPHWHLLVHETSHLEPVRERTLRLQWPHGHAMFKLVNADPKVAGYVCKYLSKSALTRIRASQGYGRPTALAKLN